MKLEGSLDAFSLPDIFQLLSFTKKTGGLHLAAGGSDGVVFFAGGQVTGASADSSRQPLARRLVGCGAVDDQALADAIGTATNGEGRGVVGALLEAGSVDADLVRQAATDQTVDAVFDLLRWSRGDFAFVVDQPNPDDVGITLPIEATLADAEARRTGWESASQVVPSPGAVLVMPVVLAADPVLSCEEWSLLALVDSRRSVSDLVDLTGSGQYAVVSTLAALVGRGLLEVRSADRDGADENDHVATVVRRQQLLAPLEAFVPEVETSAPAEVEAVVEVTAVVDAEDEAAAPEEHQPVMLGGAHVPQDVVPPRPEPFLPKRQADFDEHDTSRSAHPLPAQAGPGSSGAQLGDVVGATVTAPDPEASAMIERDPNVNRSLMLRLIAGVRGL